MHVAVGVLSIAGASEFDKGVTSSRVVRWAIVISRACEALYGGTGREKH